MPELARAYSKHADWHYDKPRTWDLAGFLKATLERVTMRIDIAPTLDSMTATLTDWGFTRNQPESFGDGFTDFIGFAWWDDRDHSSFDNTHFPNTHREEYEDGQTYEPEGDVFKEINSITTTQGSGFYDHDTWFYAWQGNEGRNRYFISNPQGATHTWPLTAADFDEQGNLKDRIVFFSYYRHLDHGGSDFYPDCIPGDNPMHSHWLIDYKYWFSDGIWNWKYHPMAIRKGDEWYSCNRLDSDSGHGDGHLAIRKGGRWNAVWNDDFNVNTSEGYTDQKDSKAGPFVALPRVGIGASPARTQEDIHEWED